MLEWEGEIEWNEMGGSEKKKPVLRGLQKENCGGKMRKRQEKSKENLKEISGFYFHR